MVECLLKLNENALLQQTIPTTRQKLEEIILIVEGKLRKLDGVVGTRASFARNGGWRQVIRMLKLDLIIIELKGVETTQEVDQELCRQNVQFEVRDPKKIGTRDSGLTVLVNFGFRIGLINLYALQDVRFEINRGWPRG